MEVCKPIGLWSTNQSVVDALAWGQIESSTSRPSSRSFLTTAPPWEPWEPPNAVGSNAGAPGAPSEAAGGRYFRGARRVQGFGRQQHLRNFRNFVPCPGVLP